MKVYSLLGARIPAANNPPPAPECPAAAPAPAAKKWGYKPLSTTQRQTIGRLATGAYAAEVARGILTAPAKGKTDAAREWRHEQYHLITGRNELDDCNQSHFRDLRSHFEALIGTPAAAARSLRDTMRTGPVKPSGSVVDTHEARELWRHKLDEALATYGYAPGYAAAIARGKYKSSVGQCCADELRSLTFAVIGNARRTGRKPVVTAAATIPTKKLTIIRPEPAADDDNQPF